jgi:hypothetical protein
VSVAKSARQSQVIFRDKPEGKMKEVEGRQERKSRAIRRIWRRHGMAGKNQGRLCGRPF